MKPEADDKPNRNEDRPGRLASSDQSPMPDGAIFISAQSQDYESARKVYCFLIAEGFACFFSDESLLEMGQAAYKAVIDAALDAASHMVVVASSRARAESKWVKYEWNTFANEQLSGRKEGNLLTILCGSLEPADLPIALRQNHALRFDTELNRLPRFLGKKPIRKDSKPDGLMPPLFQLPDYEVIEPCFAQGTFGKLWLARNAIGQWQAVKAVFLERFVDRRPYEREFDGIRRYKPISHQHPGLVRVDFVSRMKEEGYFYYVMELADSCRPGWENKPELYTPCDLRRVQNEALKKRLPLAECARIGVSVAIALSFLHSAGLAHGDVKPSNILFFNTQPKLADVGLVAEVGLGEVEHEWIGTPGYAPLAPEPTGTVQADVYGLGMVLYVTSTGRNPDHFPQIPDDLLMDDGFRQWLPILNKACQPDRAQRYATAAELSGALLRFQKGAADAHGKK